MCKQELVSARMEAMGSATVSWSDNDICCPYCRFKFPRIDIEGKNGWVHYTCPGCNRGYYIDSKFALYKLLQRNQDVDEKGIGHAYLILPHEVLALATHSESFYQNDVKWKLDDEY